MKKSWMILISVVLTLFFAAFQRMTGPTHPEDGFVETEGKRIAFSLPRSGTVGEDTRVAIPVRFPGQVEDTIRTSPDTRHGSLPVPGESCREGADAQASLYYRHYPLLDAEGWVEIPMRQENGYWVAFLPSQPMAGKLAYYVEAEGTAYHQEAPLVIRYKGSVPAGVLVPHILLMFLAMFFAVMAGLAAVLGNPLYRRYSVITLACLVLGGFVFGCLVQKHAFDVYWSGFPMGGDLTDNKTLIAVLAFLVAVLVQFWPKKKPASGKAVAEDAGQGGVPAARSGARWVVLAATLVMLGVFSVPHSANGSELDRTTGEIVSGE